MGTFNRALFARCIQIYLKRKEKQMKHMIFDSFDGFSDFCDFLIESNKTENLDECVFTVSENEWYKCDLTTFCKSYKTAIKRFFKVLSDLDEGVFSGWAECMLESCENGYFADNAPGSFAWGVEWVDEGRWYIFLNVKR